MLPGDVLLDIFDFCLGRLDDDSIYDRTKLWQTLVHVCQRWRHVVFQSPRRLDLQILCTIGTPAREMLDIWPAFPLIVLIQKYTNVRDADMPDMKNILAALEQRDRISTISVGVSSRSKLETLLPGPFPALTSLNLISDDGAIPSATGSFLRESTTHLRHLHLETTTFPALPKLLLSCTHLVTLTLRDVHHSEHVSPGVMATCLFALTKLESLELRFKYPTPQPDTENQLPDSWTRGALPALTWFDFKGVSEYLEDLMVRIEAAPVLECLQITFFNQPTFHTPRLSQLISCVPKFQALDEARVAIFGADIFVAVPSATRTLGHRLLTMGIPRRGCQPSSLAKLFISSLPLFLTVEHLYMTFPVVHWRNIKTTEWLELLSPFTSVKNLYLTKNYALRIVSALQDSDLVNLEWGTKVLPALENIFLDEPIRAEDSDLVQQAIEQFIHARQLFGHPIVVSQWVKGGNMW